MGRLTLVLGGQKSGKSSLAARRAAASGRPVVVVTPAAVRDEEFAWRVRRHQADRPAHWRTVETFDLSAAVAGAAPGAFVIVDALDTWLAEAMESAGLFVGEELPDSGRRDEVERDVLAALTALCRDVAAGDHDVVLIAGQPGLGAHAPGAGARCYVDLHGRCVQTLSAYAAEALLVVGGRVLRLEPDQPGEVTGTSEALDVDELRAAVEPADAEAEAAAQRRHAELAKPPGSLGRLEELGAQLAAISGRCPPRVSSSPVVIVAAADHGVHAQGVSDWPQSVTEAMVSTVATGGAAVNALAGAVGARVVVVDVGTRHDGGWPAGVRDERVRSGTGDIAVEPAMTDAECLAAIVAGARVACDQLAAGADLLVTGEVGISNTTASACLIAALTGADPADVVGKGANRDHARTPHKVEVVTKALARHHSDQSSRTGGDDQDGDHALRVLASLGGLEHAALVGVMLAGAAARVPVIVDGVVTNAAALVAVELCPAVEGYLIPGHISAEPGGQGLAQRLGRTALLDLGLRLGEGTGGLLAIPLVRAAAAALGQMTTLDAVTAG